MKRTHQPVPGMKSDFGGEETSLRDKLLEHALFMLSLNHGDCVTHEQIRWAVHVPICRAW